jgi:hypothetical protein
LLQGIAQRKNATPARVVLSCSHVHLAFSIGGVWAHGLITPRFSCRLVPKYKESGTTRYITHDEIAKLFAYLDRAGAEGLEHPTLILAIRLQFEFATRDPASSIGRRMKAPGPY